METATSKYSQVKIDHIDENGVAHIDSYLTSDDDETGNVLGYIVKGEIYWKDESAVHDQMVVQVIADYITEWKREEERERIRKRDNAGTLLAKKVSTFVNNYNAKNEQFVKEILNDHPTLQQSSMRLFLKVVEGMAKKEYVDGRNQASKDTAVRLIKGYKEQWVKKFMEEQGDSEIKARNYVENDAFMPSNLPMV